MELDVSIKSMMLGCTPDSPTPRNGCEAKGVSAASAGNWQPMPAHASSASLAQTDEMKVLVVFMMQFPD
jgi:hypothetical protein